MQYVFLIYPGCVNLQGKIPWPLLGSGNLSDRNANSIEHPVQHPGLAHHPHGSRCPVMFSSERKQSQIPESYLEFSQIQVWNFSIKILRERKRKKLKPVDLESACLSCSFQNTLFFFFWSLWKEINSRTELIPYKLSP